MFTWPREGGHTVAMQYVSLWAMSDISHCRKSVAAIARFERKTDIPLAICAAIEIEKAAGYSRGFKG
jgi:hypothetical protein